MSNLIRTPSNSLTAFIDPSVVGSHPHLSGSIASVPGTFPSCVEGGDEVALGVDPTLEQPHEEQCRFLRLAGFHLRGGAIVAGALEHALQHVQVGYLEIFVDKVGRHERPPFVGAKAFSPYATAPASNAVDRVTVRFKLQLSKAFADTLRVFGRVRRMNPTDVHFHIPKLSEWEAHLLGGGSLVFVPYEGGEPNWFHRMMQRFCFGVVWKRNPDRAAPASQQNLEPWSPPSEGERPDGFECLAFIPVRWQPSFENPARFEWAPSRYGMTIEGMAKGWAPLIANSLPPLRTETGDE